MKNPPSKKDILKSIIDNDGDCGNIRDEYERAYHKDLCPFDTFKKRDQYNYLGCYEAVLSNRRLTWQEAHQEYKKIAIQLLMDILLEEEIFGCEIEKTKNDSDE